MSQLSSFRTRLAYAREAADGDEIIGPTDAAAASAEAFINNLPDACLDFRIGISHDGEINFFFGPSTTPFQILIDPNGGISHYGKVGGKELFGSDQSPSEFDYFKVLRFVERKK
ncbi:hypothetical protein ASE43_09030 [Lysobacter sp. Root983]|nr:hypothetical protein ASE43_09030 [Lysobacter sp. Root983]